MRAQPPYPTIQKKGHETGFCTSTPLQPFNRFSFPPCGETVKIYRKPNGDRVMKVTARETRSSEITDHARGKRACVSGSRNPDPGIPSNTYEYEYSLLEATHRSSFREPSRPYDRSIKYIYRRGGKRG